MVKFTLIKYYLWLFDRKELERRTLKDFKCLKCGKCCYFLGIKCPFLTKDNLCRIHKYKPIHCRYQFEGDCKNAKKR